MLPLSKHLLKALPVSAEVQGDCQEINRNTQGRKPFHQSERLLAMCKEHSEIFETVPVSVWKSGLLFCDRARAEQLDHWCSYCLILTVHRRHSLLLSYKNQSLTCPLGSFKN